MTRLEIAYLHSIQGFEKFAWPKQRFRHNKYGVIDIAYMHRTGIQGFRFYCENETENQLVKELLKKYGISYHNNDRESELFIYTDTVDIDHNMDFISYILKDF